MRKPLVALFAIAVGVPGLAYAGPFDAPVVPTAPLNLGPPTPEHWTQPPAPPAMPQTYTVNRWSNGETMTGPQGEVARCQNWQNSIQCTGN